MEQVRREIRRLMLAINAVDGLYAEAAQRLGMNENELTLFYALDDGQPHSQVVISRQWMIPKTTLNTIVKHSVAAGRMVLEKREGSREKQIRLTPAGAAYAHQALRRIYDWEERAYAATTEQYSSQFIAALTGFSEQMARGAASLKQEVSHHEPQQ